MNVTTLDQSITHMEIDHVCDELGKMLVICKKEQQI